MAKQDVRLPGASAFDCLQFGVPRNQREPSSPLGADPTRRSVTVTNVGTVDVWFGASKAMTMVQGSKRLVPGAEFTLETSAALFFVVNPAGTADGSVELYIERDV